MAHGRRQKKLEELSALEAKRVEELQEKELLNETPGLLAVQEALYPPANPKGLSIDEAAAEGQSIGEAAAGVRKACPSSYSLLVSFYIRSL